MKEQRIQCEKCKYFRYDDYFNRTIMGQCYLFDRSVTSRMSCILKEKKAKEMEVKENEESGGRK